MNYEFLIKSSLLLALLYGSFALLLSRETFHRFNRVALLCVLVASLLLPAVQLTLDKPEFIGFQNIGNESVVLYSQASPTLTGSATSDPPDWKQVMYVLYIIGVLASVGIFLFQLFRFWSETKGGTCTRDGHGNTVIIRGGDFAPYSFFHIIIISASDYEHLREPILAHEQAHIRLGHSWDLMLLEIVKTIQWFNPFVYLLGRDLKAVHEYEADNAVLNLGIDAKRYQLLLVTKAVGNRLQTLGNNLSHHSLKKRIKMMHRNNSNRWQMGKALILPVLMALAVVAFAKPKTETLPASENDKIYDKTEVMASFPGGDAAFLKWLNQNVQYPKEAIEKNIQGRVLVQFIVEKDGSITQPKVVRSPDKLLSAEALRVVRKMPGMTPAKIKGKPVRSWFTIPVCFALN